MNLSVVYVIRKFEKGKNENNKKKKKEYSITLKKDGEYKFLFFDTTEEMPTYAKLDSETGDVWWYKEFSEMTEEDKQIFKNLEAGKYAKKEEEKDWWEFWK